jgi:glycosyltransferase involved in cell wall biosynthesis
MTGRLADGRATDRTEVRPELSVIIPAYNEERYLGPTLDAVDAAILEHARVCARSIEVVVVDNNSSDRTADVARARGARVVFEGRNQIAAARNAGGRAARGDIVAFVDADSRISANLLARVCEVMASGDFVGGGVIRMYRDAPSVWATILGVWRNVIGYRLFGVSTGLIYTRREAFDLIGGFDERYYAAEEGLFIMALKRLGRQQGTSFCNIDDGHIVTSARKFQELSALRLVWTGLKFVLFPWKLRSRRACAFWYEGR